jgi:electron transfer flavoprotein beta subunit
VKVVVIYKWARDPRDAAVRGDGSVDWRGAKMAAGEDDPAAVAVGLAVSAASGASLVGLTIGDGDASWALARGVERAVTVPDAPSLADNAETAGLLAAAVRWIGEVSVVIIGDAEAYPEVPAALAGALGWPALLGVSSATFAGGRLVASRRAGDSDQTLSLGLPALLGVAALGTEKQAPGMKEVLAARRRPVTAVPMAELGISPLGRLQPQGARVPETGSARIFEGSPDSAARQLVAALRADGVL